MTLRRKMGLQITAMIVGLLLIAGASLKGFNGLRQNYGAAVEGIQDLREVYEVGSHLAVARTVLETSVQPESGRGPAINQVQRALTKLEATEPWGHDAAATHRALRASLLRALDELLRAQRENGPVRTDVVSDAIEQTREASFKIRTSVELAEARAEARRRSTLMAVGLLSTAVVLAAVLLGLWQYRSVLNPLNRLGGAVRRVASGHFGVRIVESGMPSGADNEFARLADDFNRMADQLDGFYRELEQKVAEKSKELIRSERLASVGYLAAGVAHEINNPLGIISGYAEYALAEMKSGRPAAAGEIDGTLRVIRDEAFRCKDITGKLLSLARPGETSRQPVDLAKTAEQVVSVLAGLRNFKERKITVRAESRGQPLVVDAIEGEIKQVLMNLLLNALEATDDGTGEVAVTVTSDGEIADGGGGGNGAGGRGLARVVLAVSDNGRGMSPETLERVFEPFFTERRPRDPDAPPRPGTGLGLSITHAIVQSHHGRITAHSDGPGHGSRFVIELPASRV